MATSTPWADWEAKAAQATDSELAHIVADCRAAEQAMRGWNPEREGFYADQAATFQREVMRRRAVQFQRSAQ